MLRRLLCILLIFCLLAGYAAAEEDATAAPTQEPPEGALVNGMVDGAGESAVQEMQQRLIDLGLLTGEADGHFGDGTEDAVKLFQQMYGLSDTGYADEATLEALSTAEVGVLEVQERLGDVGVLSGEADGVLGAATEEAISTFQQMYGLPDTGVADPETRELLFSESNLIFGVQTKLIELTYLTGVADGMLGPATETAISEFQEVHGLTVTGVADPQTRDLLLGGGDLMPKPTPTPTARAHGAQGSDIELSQQRLAEWGFLGGSVDGHYGDDTEDAVKEFKTYQ
ncbi:MAG TPA: peptidoglycan-binding protein, partial [Candidatus Pullichristensenella avicola]|nr:peptidoglycan-binding protein [Candidatus Pullichristensenella avicola]